MSEMETPEASTRALLLVDACHAYSRGNENLNAYPELLARTAAELRGDEWETVKTLHALARIAYVAVKLAASNSLRSEEAILGTIAEAIDVDDQSGPEGHWRPWPPP